MGVTRARTASQPGQPGSVRWWARAAANRWWPSAITAAVAVGVPHERWGEGVGLLVVTSPQGPPVGRVPDEGVGQIRDMLRAHLPAHALPQRVHVVDALPTRGPGKPDRDAAVRMLG